MEVDEALLTRRSVRAFTSDPVAKETIVEILEVASRAPSGTNMQPWKAHVVMGAARDRLSEAARAAFHADDYKAEAEYRYYPAEFREPYRSRRRKVGWDLYGLLGIARGESDKMARQHARNFDFFGAPVGVMFTIDRDLEIGSWLDYGMFLGNVMLAARQRGLHTCPQAAWPPYHKVVREVLAIPDGEMLICGMSIGVLDESHVTSRLTTERQPVAGFATFHES